VKSQVSDDLSKRFVEALRIGNVSELKLIASEITDDAEFVSIKCRGCGEFVAFIGQRSLIVGALGGGDPVVTYAILRHMQTCPKHDVKIPAPKSQFGATGDISVSRAWEERFRAAFARWGQENVPALTYDQWFTQYVESKKP
jgi:hypothetical protein